MKKLNALLHDVSVINFPVIGRLVLRYRYISGFGLLCFLVLFPYLYFSQAVIHQKQVFFKVGMTTDAPAVSSLTNLVEDASEYINKREIISSVNTHAFRTSLAEHLLSSPDLSKFDLGPIAKMNSGFQKTFRACTTKECKIDLLRATAPSLFGLDTEEGTDRFNLTVTSRSAVTTMGVLLAFQKALSDTRFQNASEEYQKQINQISQLISKSRTEIEDNGGFAKLAASESLDSLVLQQTSKINSILARLNIESDQHSFQKIRLKESSITANKDIEGSEKLQFEKISKISRRIEELRQNLALVTATPTKDRSPADEHVIGQLKEELSMNEKLLRTSGGDPKRNLAFEDSFITAQINNQSSFAFDYKVTSAKVKGLQKEYETAKAELNELFDKKAHMDNDLLALKPDLEYLKQMESKLVTLKMKKAAITPDVFFDHYGSDVASFKRNSLIQVSVFSFLLISFALFFLVIVFYLRDDRIYDEFEIEKCCDDLQVIGQAPHFD